MLDRKILWWENNDTRGWICQTSTAEHQFAKTILVFHVSQKSDLSNAKLLNLAIKGRNHSPNSLQLLKRHNRTGGHRHSTHRDYGSTHSTRTGSSQTWSKHWEGEVRIRFLSIPGLLCQPHSRTGLMFRSGWPAQNKCHRVLVLAIFFVLLVFCLFWFSFFASCLVGWVFCFCLKERGIKHMKLSE